jgi:hypothetical protein
MSDDTPTDGWAISVGPSMSGVVARGNPGESPPVITAILPDGEELTADEHGAFERDLPPRTRIFIAGQLAMTVPLESEHPPQA